jgi:predicted GIY-YIG superfamily endonuclease
MAGCTHHNYLLGNTLNNKTYNGYTVDLKRRLRQHNGELKGGARYTSQHPGAWFMVLSISSLDFTKNTALSFEWSVRYPTNKRPRPHEYSGVVGRIRSLPHVFANPKFSGMQFVVTVHTPSYYDIVYETLKDFPHVYVHGVDTFQEAGIHTNTIICKDVE